MAGVLGSEEASREHPLISIVSTAGRQVGKSPCNLGQLLITRDFNTGK
jgi:hypothetical protein